MDFGIVLRVLGLLLLTESACMIPSLLVSVYYSEGDTMAFLLTILLTAAAGFILSRFKSENSVVRYREGFMIVGLGWILASIFGSFPFLFAGVLDSFTDALFETVSGFSTTGASVIKNVELMPNGILFWRAFTHWLGGMGILVFTLALLPTMGMGTMQIFRAESPGPSPDKITPKLGQTAKMLYAVYSIITAAQIISLKIAGMSLFDAVTHTFATVGTGGYSTRNASIGAFNSPGIEWITTAFMFICGINFSLYYDAIHGNFRTLLKDREFRFYAMVVAAASILITINVSSNVFHNIWQSIRYAVFHVVSFVTTTGFVTYDYDLWPDFSRVILFLLLFVGGCAGSTAGALKNIRILLVLKIIKRELYKLIHPKAVIAIRVGDKAVPEEILQSVVGFVLLYILIFIAGTLILLTQGMDIISSASSAASALGNVGPGFGMIGPTFTFADQTALCKIVLTALMILGRLEIYTIFIMVVPSFWDN